MSELAAALGCAEITVTGEMDRLGIARRPTQHRLAEGRRVLATKRAEEYARREDRARDLGFADLRSYLLARHHVQRWPRSLIADELGIPAVSLPRLMKAENVPGLRGVTTDMARVTDR